MTSGYSCSHLHLISVSKGPGPWILTHGSCSITIDPATEEELGTIPEMGLEETKAAIAAAGKAFQTWGKTTAKVSSLCGEEGIRLTEPFVARM